MDLSYSRDRLSVKGDSFRFFFDAETASGELIPPLRRDGSDEPALRISFVPRINDRLPATFALAPLGEDENEDESDIATFRLKYKWEERDIVLTFFVYEAGIAFSYGLADAGELKSLGVGPMNGGFFQVFNFDPDLERFDIPEKVGARLQISSRKGTYNSFFQLDQGSYMMPPYLLALYDRRRFIGIGLLDVPDSAVALDAQVNIDQVTLRFDYVDGGRQGPYESPRIALYLADSAEEILDAYRDSVEEDEELGGHDSESSPPIPHSVADPERGRRAFRNPHFEDWWTSPIYTTWGDQVYAKHIAQGNFPSEAGADKYLTADLVNRALARLKEKGIAPGTIVLDEGWSRCLGDWTPDDSRFGGSLAGFIGGLHARGYRVVLHFNPFLVKTDAAIAAERPDFLVKAADGKPRTVARSGADYHLFDWTNAALRERLGKAIAFMVATDGLNADGVKVSGTKFLAEATDQFADPKYGRGERYLSALLGDLRAFAQEAKPNAPIFLACLNPLFARYFDIVRLGNTSEVNHELYVHRARTASRLLPDKLIDTDDWASFMKVIGPATAMKAVCGVPNIFSAFYRGDGRYRVQGAAGGAPMAIPDEVYNVISSVWKVYEHSRNVPREMLNIDFDRMEFSTQAGKDGSFVRTYQGGNILAVYLPDEIVLTSLLDTKAIIAVPQSFRVASVTRFDRAGRSEQVPFQRCLGNKIIFRAKSCRGETFYYWIEGRP